MTIPTYKLARTKDAFWVQGPLGPFLGEGGMRVRDRHPGLSYDQWASIATFNGGDSPYLRPIADAITTAKFPQYVSNYSGGGPLPYLRGFDGWGDLEDEDDEDEFGDVCTRTKKRYKRKTALYKKKQKQFKRRGRRFLGIRTGSVKKRLAKIKRRMAKIKAKARKKGCYWASKAKKAHKKKMAAETKRQDMLEKQIDAEHKQSQKNLEDATAEVVATGQTAGPNPILIVGLVAGAGILMVMMAKKNKGAK
jgi:ElaB/YqjD/DUF883 family membrane-anchored ribosome-binding protein